MQDEKVPPGGRKREPRRKTALAARLRMEGSWSDATVLNMSSRGVMMRTREPLRQGTYVEIRRGTDLTIVGRVVWCNGPYAGVRAQDAIDVDAVTCAPRQAARSQGLSQPDRRSSERRSISPSAQAERSRQMGTLGQYAAVVAGVVFGAMIAASYVHDLLQTTFGKAGKSLLGATVQGDVP